MGGFGNLFSEQFGGGEGKELRWYYKNFKSGLWFYLASGITIIPFFIHQFKIEYS
jgi:hypothetical protein